MTHKGKIKNGTHQETPEQLWLSFETKKKRLKQLCSQVETEFCNSKKLSKSIAIMLGGKRSEGGEWVGRGRRGSFGVRVCEVVVVVGGCVGGRRVRKWDCPCSFDGGLLSFRGGGGWFPC